MPSYTWPSLLAACILCTLNLGVADLSAQSSDIDRGEAILQQKCARCHGIGRTDESHHPQAPPFRDVVKRYPVEYLSEALAEGIVSGHPDMPEFVFQPDEINAILAYLDSLKRVAPNKP
jgi:mono/diheme cytochrome c family protein